MIKKTILFSLCLAFLFSISGFAYNWNTVTVSSVKDSDCNTFIGTNSDGNPTIIFQGLDSYLLCATYKDGDWNITNANEKGSNWDDAAISLSHRYASNPDKSIVYVLNGKLIYAYRNSGRWVTEYVDYAVNAGNHPAMLITDDGLPIISYYDKTTGNLKCAFASEAKAAVAADFTTNAVSPVSLTLDSPTITESGKTNLRWNCTDNAATFVSSTNFNAFSISGSTSVYPVKTITYKITLKLSTGKNVSASATLKVTPLIPTLTLSASTTKVVETRMVKLTWSSTNAVQVVANNFGAIGVNGSIVKNPGKTTTYSITVATSAGKKVTKKVKVKVVKMVPVIFMAVSPNVIPLGETIALAWQCEDTSSMTSNFGETILSGAKLITPPKSGSFTINGVSSLGRKGKSRIKYSIKKITNFIDEFAPAITSPKVNDAISFAQTSIDIAVFTADPSGLSSVSAKIIGPNGFEDSQTLAPDPNIRNLYVGEYFAPINYSEVPASYTVTILSLDKKGNMGESAESVFSVPGTDEAPPPPPPPGP